MRHRFTVELDLSPDAEASLCDNHDEPADWTVADLAAALVLAVQPGEEGATAGIVAYVRSDARASLTLAHPPEGEEPGPNDPYRLVAARALALDGPSCAVAKDTAVAARPWLNAVGLAEVLATLDEWFAKVSDDDGEPPLGALSDALDARVYRRCQAFALAHPPDERATMTAAPARDQTLRACLILAELAGETDDWAVAVASEVRPVETASV